MKPTEEELMPFLKKLEAFQALPTPSGPKDRRWLADEEKQRAALNEFWEAVRGHDLEAIGCLHPIWKTYLQDSDMIFLEKEQESFNEVLTLGNDPDHLEDVRQYRERILVKILASEENKATLCKKDDPPKKWATSSPELQSSPTPSKQKVKTHGIAAFPKDVQPQEPAPEEPAPIRISVNKRTLETFENMRACQKDLPWAAFFQALRDAQLVASEGAGSQTNFEGSPNSPWATMGKIGFHKPHPDSKIRAIRLRWWWKRLAKWFEWTEDTFILQDRRGEE
jgi:hypothetical protein